MASVRGFCEPQYDDRTIESLLKTLDRVIVNRQEYYDQRQEKIDSVESIINNTKNEKVALPQYMALADLYNGFVTDSALMNYKRGEDLARKLGDTDWALRFRLKNLSDMPLVGLGETAATEFEQIPIDSLSESMKIAAYEAGRQLYSYQISFTAKNPEQNQMWMKKLIEIDKRLLDLRPNETYYRKLSEGEYYYITGRLTESKAALIQLMDSVPADSNIAARAASLISKIARQRGDLREAKYFLTISAIADMKSATREMMSLQELGVMLYNDGDVTRAYNYLTTALASAVECNAAMRMLQSSESLPVIEAANRAEIEKSRYYIYMTLFAMAVLLVMLLGVLLKLRNEMSRMKVLQKVLVSSNKVKEMYMSQFLNLCTTYMDKLNQFCKIASRKISTGHADDFYKMIKSGRFIEEQSRDFYNTFDRAFLHIYPTFIEDVNKLLRPEDVIELREGELLNTDLRILAFMRLGIDESPRIAQMLNYSIHTIYAYRNRLKNRAIDRENFETDIMKIGQVE